MPSSTSDSTEDADSASAAAETSDLYAFLGLSRDATQPEIATAYRRLSRVVHPDKRGAEGAAASSSQADAAYQRIRRAYDVLRDPESRRIYDEFGLEGLRALSDGAVALRGRGALEIREELAKLRRLREEAAVMELTQPATRLNVGLNVASIFSPQLDEDGQPSVPRAVYFVHLGFSQNTSFVLTPQHRLILAGSLGKSGRRYVPSVSLTLRSRLTDRLTSDVTCGLNYRPTAAGKLSYRLSPNLLASLRTEVSMMQDGELLPTLTPALSCQISPRCLGTLSYTWNSPTKGARAEVMCQLADGWHAKAAAYLSANNLGARLSCSRESGDLRLGASASLTLASLWTLQYSAAQRVSEYSEAAMSVKFGPGIGVRLKLTLSRGNQVYSMPVTLSEWVDPAAIIYGTAAPVLAYVVLCKCVYAPWLLRFQRDSQRLNSDAQATARAEARATAMAAQSLMRETAANSRESERAKAGLVIDRAVYGYLSAVAGDSAAEATDDDAESSLATIDVTDCLQILVDGSRLEIPGSLTKADLPGFCDPGGAGGGVSHPGGQRHLLVRYTFAGSPHTVLLGDSDPVRLPQRKHAI